MATDTPLTVHLLPLQFTVSHQDSKRARARKDQKYHHSPPHAVPCHENSLCRPKLYVSPTISKMLLQSGYTGQLPGVKLKGITCSANIPD